ncbi:hypothetical protein CIB84_004922 [Bambusicola thoracicus]|uniref:Uncharacterized protein n=1 Tax=Bambusicola thoracicus TaxID=9083 RepID=A0A2P4T4N4_BAMTH|nr:hypothetical protein CIB84_004922 [Bambusicola thoracicus]
MKMASVAVALSSNLRWQWAVEGQPGPIQAQAWGQLGSGVAGAKSEAVLPQKPPACLESRTHTQLSPVLCHHTHNAKQAWVHLKQYILWCEGLAFKAASLLGELYCQESSAGRAKAIWMSQQVPY